MKSILTTILLLISFILPVFAEDTKKDPNDSVNIAFTIDKNYDLYVMLAMQSIIRSKNSETNYKFYILENNLTYFQKKKIKKFAEINKTSVVFYHISTNNIDKGRQIYNNLTRITPIGMARILLPSVMPNEIKKVLYLDADILVTDDLKELYDTDLGEYYVGMVKNNRPMNYELYEFGDEYYNSGVILMDLNKLRENKIEDKIIAYVENHWQNFSYVKKDFKDDVSPFFIYPDQDLINLVLRGKIKSIESRWNLQDFNQRKMIDKNFKGIVHFIGDQKPWLLENIYSNANDFYYQNWVNSPFVIYIPIQWYTLKCEKKITVYKDIFKLCKNIIKNI